MFHSLTVLSCVKSQTIQTPHSVWSQKDRLMCTKQYFCLPPSLWQITLIKIHSKTHSVSEVTLMKGGGGRYLPQVATMHRFQTMVWNEEWPLKRGQLHYYFIVVVLKKKPIHTFEQVASHFWSGLKATSSTQSPWPCIQTDDIETALLNIMKYVVVHHQISHETYSLHMQCRSGLTVSFGYIRPS